MVLPYPDDSDAGGGSHLVFVIGDESAYRSNAHRRIARLSQKASKAGLIIPAPAFCHPIEAFQTITDGLILHLLADFPYK